ncbi:MAG: FAD-binding oxidoreductase [Solirubrobacterales bacterium]|nr:FAD-binding oxidoreductase [Solirubrobacterales bacterium]
MKAAVVDPEARTVRAGAGLSWGELDAATQEHGLAVTGGRVTTTGVTGFTLGSGSGWLERAMGLAPDNLVAARMVAADGRAVAVTAQDEPELLWALKGGGGNFGVVTEMTFSLMPVGPMVTGGMRMYPFERAGEVLRAYRDAMAGASDALCGGVALLCAPPLDFVPEAVRGKPIVAVIVLWAGAPEDAEAGLAPLAALGAPAMDLVGPMPYVAVQGLLDAGNPYGVHREYPAGGFLDVLTDDAVDAVVGLAAAPPSPQTVIVLQPMGGAYARVADDATPLGHRGADWAYQLLAQWERPEDDARLRDWVRDARDRLSGSRVDVSFANFVPGDDRVEVAYAPAALERLRAVKRAWDPGNVFRHNHNIAP